jgi:hypothetical protein
MWEQGIVLEVWIGEKESRETKNTEKSWYTLQIYIYNFMPQ